MADNEYILRLEIAKLLQKQREMQLRELDTFGMRVLELGAETKTRSEITVQQAVHFVKDPMSNKTLKAQLETATEWISQFSSKISQQFSVPPSVTKDDHVVRKSDDEGEVRSLSKIELLERQLDELKKMLEMQQQMSMMTMSNARSSTSSTTPVHGHSYEGSAPQCAPRPPVSDKSNSGISQSGWSEGTVVMTPARPKMTDIMAAAKNVQLKKVSSAGIAGGAQRRNVPEVGLAGVLRSAMDKRFQHLQKSSHSPNSEYASDSTGSPFDSPHSPRRKGRRLTTSASMLAAASAARRASRCGFEDGGLPSAEIARANTPSTPVAGSRRQPANEEADHGFSPLSPPSDCEAERVRPNLPTAGTNPRMALLGEIASFKTNKLQKADKENETTASAAPVKKAPVPNMLAAIKGFDKSGLRSASVNHAPVEAEKPAKAALTSPQGFNPADVMKVQLKKTGSKHK